MTNINSQKMVTKPINNTRSFPFFIFPLSPFKPFNLLALASLALCLSVSLYSPLSCSSSPMTDTHSPTKTHTKALNYEAYYRAKVKGLNVKGIKTVRSTGENRYRASWKVKALWMKIDEWSEFEITKGNVIRPIHYHYQEKGFGKKESINLFFDWETQQLTSEMIRSNSVEKKQFALTEGVQDKLTYQVQMQLDLISHSLPDSLSYNVASDRGLEQYRFTRSNEALPKSQLNQKNNTVFSRQKKNRLVEIHFAEDIFYTPTLIRHSKNDKFSDIHLSGWQLLID